MDKKTLWISVPLQELGIRNEELGIKSVENMTKENKARLVKFLWNLASAILAAVGTALGVSCAVA